MTPHADTEILSAYLDGEVPASERARLERHLASCAECSARKSALEGVIRSVRGLPPVMATEAEHVAMRRAVLEAARGRAPSFALGSRSRPEVEPELERVPKRGPAWKLFAATAAVAAALAGIVGIVVVRGAGPNATTRAAAPAPSASPPGPALANDADVRSYVQSRPEVRTFLGQPQAEAGDASPAAPAPAPAHVPSAFGQLNTITPPAPTARSAPNSDRALAPPSPATLGSCARAAVPEGAALLDATAVTYQGTPAWVIASGAQSGSTGALDRVVVDVRSQSTCTVLDQTTITP
jgi:negative regulator of sigma E activity